MVLGPAWSWARREPSHEWSQGESGPMPKCVFRGPNVTCPECSWGSNEEEIGTPVLGDGSPVTRSTRVGSLGYNGTVPKDVSPNTKDGYPGTEEGSPGTRDLSPDRFPWYQGTFPWS